MHMMFVDESGDPGYPRDGCWATWAGSTLYVRLGVIIHGWKWRAWNNRLLQFKRNRALNWDAEIKAHHVRRGNGAFQGWAPARRQSFLRDLTVEIGMNRDITLIGVCIDKRQVDASVGSSLARPEIRSMELLLERYNGFLDTQNDRSGIVVLDPMEEANDDNIRHFQNYLMTHSAHLHPLHIVESTFFAKSHTSTMIQVADVCTNVFYRQMGRSDDSPEYKAVAPRFWRKGSHVRGYGIKVWP